MGLWGGRSGSRGIVKSNLRGVLLKSLALSALLVLGTGLILVGVGGGLFKRLSDFVVLLGESGLK